MDRVDKIEQKIKEVEGDIKRVEEKVGEIEKKIDEYENEGKGINRKSVNKSWFQTIYIWSVRAKLAVAEKWGAAEKKGGAAEKKGGAAEKWEAEAAGERAAGGTASKKNLYVNHVLLFTDHHIWELTVRVKKTSTKVR